MRCPHPRNLSLEAPRSPGVPFSPLPAQREHHVKLIEVLIVHPKRLGLSSVQGVIAGGADHPTRSAQRTNKPDNANRTTKRLALVDGRNIVLAYPPTADRADLMHNLPQPCGQRQADRGIWHGVSILNRRASSRQGADKTSQNRGDWRLP